MSSRVPGVLIGVLAVAGVATSVRAADLQTATIVAFDRYVRLTEARVDEELRLAARLQQDFLPKVRLAQSEGAISCTATQRVWSFFPSLTLTRNVGESRMFWETSNRVQTLTSERFPYTQVTIFDCHRSQCLSDR